ncbi:MAG: sigma-54-dependent transcriptional regulator [Desulfobacteraceae bacterium]
MGESFSILVVDDEKSILRRCVRLLSRQGHNVVGAMDPTAALEMVEKRNPPFDLVIADIRMPGMDGIELLERIRGIDSSIEVVMMTGYAAVETAVNAMKKGAYDYLAKPFEMEEFLHTIQNVLEKRSLQREVRELRDKLRVEKEIPLILEGSPAMAKVARFIEKVARVNCNILIQGESGTGKELVARAIHNMSPRGDSAFVVADCAALTGSLLESELFGHVKGAFTGAHSERKGYFESAHGGTLFLDEVSELPLDLQGKLLRAVQEHVVVKVGGTRGIKVDTRLIAATNRNLERRVAAGAFREDLFYRLNVVNLTIPPLRERQEEIPVLARHFLKRYSAQLELDKVPRIPNAVMERMTTYEWPGNVRQLENAIQRAIVLSEGGEISLSHLLPKDPLADYRASVPSKPSLSFHQMKHLVLEDFTKRYLREYMKQHRGNVTRAAEALGMRRTSLQRLLRRHGVDSWSFR